MFAAGDRAELARRMEEFARSPGQYRETVPVAGLGWSDHVGRVVGAYEDARRALPANTGHRG